MGCVGEEQTDLTLENLYCCGEFRALGIIGYNKKYGKSLITYRTRSDRTRFSGLKTQGAPHSPFFFFLVDFLKLDYITLNSHVLCDMRLSHLTL